MHTGIALVVTFEVHVPQAIAIEVCGCAHEHDRWWCLVSVMRTQTRITFHVARAKSKTQRISCRCFECVWCFTFLLRTQKSSRDAMLVRPNVHRQLTSRCAPASVVVACTVVDQTYTSLNIRIVVVMRTRIGVGDCHDCLRDVNPVRS